MKVLIPTPLRSYTDGAREVAAHGATLADVLADLDHQFPGIRFRMIDEQGRTRPHMRIFVNGVAVFDLDRPLADRDEIAIVQALSGG
ncbi:MAG TPA: MoaD/ThiS family protein [Rhodocyclaceae bacterium]|nr:MoaD/ThiS family protein [Rhodocyclaceae bacterium]